MGTRRRDQWCGGDRPAIRCWLSAVKRVSAMKRGGGPRRPPPTCAWLLRRGGGVFARGDAGDAKVALVFFQIDRRRPVHLLVADFERGVLDLDTADLAVGADRRQAMERQHELHVGLLRGG